MARPLAGLTHMTKTLESMIVEINRLAPQDEKTPSRNHSILNGGYSFLKTCFTFNFAESGHFVDCKLEI